MYSVHLILRQQQHLLLRAATAQHLLLRAATASMLPSRNAYVFKRTRFPKRLVDKKLATQEYLNELAAKGQPFEDLLVQHPYEDLMTYEVVEDEQAPVPVKVLLLKNTEDFGRRGQIVTVDDPLQAKTDLLLPGLAVYATPDNLEKYRDIAISEDNWKFSSDYVKQMLPKLSRQVLPVTMNLHNEWTIQPFHIRVCLQRIRVDVPLDAIEMNEDEIKGPNLDYEQKEFYFHLKINNFERVPIRCVLHHWSDQSPSESDKLKAIGWMHRFHEPIFEKDRKFLAKMKRAAFGNYASEQPDIHTDLERYKEWKRTRDQILQEVD